MHATDHVVPVVAAQNAFEFGFVARDEVSFGGQANDDVAGVAPPAALDVFNVEIVLPFSHAQLRVAPIGRQPVHEQVVREPQLGQPGRDGVFHVLLHRTGGVPAARGMDVVVDEWQAHAAVKRTK